jgi:phage tail-like protein
MLDLEFKPPVAFYFNVRLLPNSKLKGAVIPDTSFMEVSGIGSKMVTEPMENSGNCSDVKHFAKGFTYDTLILKRGITPSYSSFAIWCNKNLIENYDNAIITATLQISLLRDTYTPFCVWLFFNAYPMHWYTNHFDSKANEIAVETIEIKYSYFRRLL